MGFNSFPPRPVKDSKILKTHVKTLTHPFKDNFFVLIIPTNFQLQ